MARIRMAIKKSDHVNKNNLMPHTIPRKNKIKLKSRIPHQKKYNNDY